MSLVFASLTAVVAVIEMVASEPQACSALDSSCGTQGESFSISLMQQDLSLMYDRIEPGHVEEFAHPQTPFNAMRCNGTQVRTTSSLTYDDYDSMINEMRLLYSKLPVRCDAQSCPQGDFAGCVVRLAAHDFMDYDSGDGGSDGCISFDDPDNRGLQECLYKGDNDISVVDAYEKFCTRVSLADFLVIAAEAVMTFTRENVLKGNSSRSAFDFRTSFKYGRTTNTKCANRIGLMPDPENSCDDIRRVLVERMGLDWNLSSALMGAHTLGKAEVKNSGYHGSWTPLQDSNKFDNSYYRSVLLKGWAPELKVGGNVLKNQWQRVDFGMDESRFGKEMMLNTDLCLYHIASDIQDKDFYTGGVHAKALALGIPLEDVRATARPIELRAATGIADECQCAWVMTDGFDDVIAANGGEYCGVQEYPVTSATPLIEDPDIFKTLATSTSLKDGPLGVNITKQRLLCCGLQPDIKVELVDIRKTIDCGNSKYPGGYAASPVRTFAVDENAWLEQFTRAWHIATSNGQGSLKPLRPSHAAELSSPRKIATEQN